MSKRLLSILSSRMALPDVTGRDQGHSMSYLSIEAIMAE
jgi:hypothetical protein